MSINITNDDLLNALSALLTTSGIEEDDFAWLTTAEISEKMNLPANRVNAMLWKLKRSGKLEVKKVRRETLDNRTSLVPGYRVKT